MWTVGGSKILSIVLKYALHFAGGDNNVFGELCSSFAPELSYGNSPNHF